MRERHCPVWPVVAVFVILTAIAGVQWLWPWLKVGREQQRFRETAQAILLGMDPLHLSHDAAYFSNNDGIIVSYADGTWIAVIYKDIHVYPSWSLAVAKDSEGHFYESSEHFCGAFYFLKEDIAAGGHGAPTETPGAITLVEADRARIALGSERLHGIRRLLVPSTAGDAACALEANGFVMVGEASGMRNRMKPRGVQ